MLFTKYNSKVEYTLLDYNTGIFKSLDLNTINDINEYLKGENEIYNIYTILNDFDSRRRIDNLLYFRKLGFDIDSNELDLEELIKNIKDKTNLSPTIINKTYKGYHVIFDLDDSIRNLDKEQYKRIYKIINTVIGGDPKMKDITGVLKAPGYYDRKDNRDYLITNIYKTSHKLIITDLEALIKEPLIFDNKREDIYLKDINKNLNNYTKKEERYNKIDVVELIDVLNKEFNYNIIIENNGIKGTSGLKIEENYEGISYINDFANKGRAGIKGFVNNYILTLKKFDKDSKEIERRNIYRRMGINSNENHEILKLETSLIIGARKKEFFIEEKDELNKINNVILQNESLGELLQLVATINHLKIKSLKSGIIYESDILDTLGLYNNGNNKKKVRNMLLKMEYIKKHVVRQKLIEGKIRKVETNENIFEYDKITLDNGKIGYIFRIKYLGLHLTNIDERLLKIKNSSKFLGALLLLDNLNLSKCNAFTIKIEDLMVNLDITTTNGIQKTLDTYKKLKIIKGYHKKGNYIIYNK